MRQLDSASLTALLADAVREHGVPGAQLAVAGESGTVTAVAGDEVAGTGRRVTGESAFPLGSLTKPFTATVAMVLVADGDVELDLPIAKYLPELGAAANGADAVTLRQLLSHTGGLAADVDETEAATTRRRWDAAGAAVAHPPGTAFSYSNVGYLLVGRLIEEMTGMTWRQAVESILLRPLGIAPSFVFGPTARPFVAGHVVRPDGAVIPIAAQTVTALSEPVAALAAGAADLVALAGSHLAAARGKGLLDQETAEQMRHDHLTGLAADSFGLADGWGLGWSLYRRGGREWFGHDGTGDGAWSHLRVEPVSGTVVALVTNAGNGVAVWGAVVERLRSVGLEVASYPMSAPGGDGPSVPTPAECVGRYVNGSFTYTVEADGEQTYLVPDPEPRVGLACFADLRFHTVPGPGAAPLAGRFLRDPATGRVTLLQSAGRLFRRV
jgi:CubicO group peptidase (beta-lactamase class C family)